jgi:hypothetical protein
MFGGLSGQETKLGRSEDARIVVTWKFFVLKLKYSILFKSIRARLAVDKILISAQYVRDSRPRLPAQSLWFLETPDLSYSWPQRYRWQRNYIPRAFENDLDVKKICYEYIAEKFEVQIRDHGPCLPDREQWTTPKVRFVDLIEEHEIGDLMRSREEYVRYIENSYWTSVAEARKRYRPPSPLALTGGSEALHELQLSEGYGESVCPSWSKSVRETILFVRGWLSPFTLEWIEASEARLDRDSWPWRED